MALLNVLSLPESYACGMQVAVVLCPYLLTTEGSFDSPTAVPQVPWLYARAYSVRIVSSAFRQASRVSKRRFVSTGWVPKTKTKSIHFIASSSNEGLCLRRTPETEAEFYWQVRHPPCGPPPSPNFDWRIRKPNSRRG